MIKGNVRKLAALSLSLALAMSYTAFAQTNLSPKEGCNSAECVKVRTGDKKDYFNKLVNELGLTEKDIIDARSNGKSLFDLAKTKGYSPDQVRSKALKIKTENLNKAVSEGKLTKEKAEEITRRIEERFKNWDGSLNFNKGNHEHSFFHDLDDLKELGITEEDIKKAKESNKSLFDIVKEKKGLNADQVRDSLIKMKEKDLKEDVSEGELTQEKANEILEKYKMKIKDWDGKFKSHKREN
jgi:lipoate-protein ligase A